MCSDNGRLRQEYEESRRLLQRRLKDDDLSDRDRKLLESMLRSTDDAIHLMETGHLRQYGEVLVGGTFEIEKVAARRGIGEIDYEFLFESESSETEEPPIESEAVLADFLSILSRREAQFMLAYERGLSMAKIAQYTGVSKSTVQSYITRARAKLQNAKNVQLSLWDGVQHLA